jgi:hypothetical protein
MQRDPPGRGLAGQAPEGLLERGAGLFLGEIVLGVTMEGKDQVARVEDSIFVNTLVTTPRLAA